MSLVHLRRTARVAALATVVSGCGEAKKSGARYATEADAGEVARGVVRSTTRNASHGAEEGHGQSDDDLRRPGPVGGLRHFPHSVLGHQPQGDHLAGELRVTPVRVAQHTLILIARSVNLRGSTRGEERVAERGDDHGGMN